MVKNMPKMAHRRCKTKNDFPIIIDKKPGDAKKIKKARLAAEAAKAKRESK